MSENVTIRLEGLTPKQVGLCEIVWRAQTEAEIDALVLEHGVDVIIIRNMMIAEYLDQVAARTDISGTRNILDKIFKG